MQKIHTKQAFILMAICYSYAKNTHKKSISILWLYSQKQNVLVCETYIEVSQI